MTARAPVVVRQTADSITYRHCEPMFRVTGSAVFGVDQKYINPGSKATFNWLATQARGFEKYTFHSLGFLAKARCPSSTIGSLSMAFDYNATEDTPTTSTIMGSYAGASEDAPWKDVFITVDCSRITPNLYIRRGTVPLGSDRKMYDCGFLLVGTEDCVDAAILSKVWACYEVTLSIPQVAPEGDTDVGTITSTAGRNAANPLGTASTKAGYLLSAAVSGQHVAFQAEVGVRYYLSCQLTGTTISTFGIASVLGATQTNTIVNCWNASATLAATEVILTATADNVTFDLSTAAATVTTSHLVLSIVPENSGF